MLERVCYRDFYLNQQRKVELMIPANERQIEVTMKAAEATFKQYGINAETAAALLEPVLKKHAAELFGAPEQPADPQMVEMARRVQLMKDAAASEIHRQFPALPAEECIKMASDAVDNQLNAELEAMEKAAQAPAPAPTAAKPKAERMWHKAAAAKAEPVPAK